MILFATFNSCLIIIFFPCISCLSIVDKTMMDIIELIFALAQNIDFFQRNFVSFLFFLQNIQDIFGQISISSVNSTSFTIFWKLLPTFQQHKIAKEKHSVTPLNKDHKHIYFFNLSRSLLLNKHCSKLSAFQVQLICYGVLSRMYKIVKEVFHAFLVSTHCQNMWVNVYGVLGTQDGQST